MSWAPFPSLEVIGQVGALLRLSLGKAAFLEPGVTEVHHAGKSDAASLTVASDAAHREAPKIHPVVGPLTAGETVPVSLASGSMICQSDLERRVDRFRAGVGKEDMVQRPGRQLGQLVCQAERVGESKLKMRRVVELAKLPGDGLLNFGAAMAGRHAKQPRAAIENFFTFIVPVVDALGADLQARVLLEFTVRREWHPVRVKRGLTRFRIGWHGVHYAGSERPRPCSLTALGSEVCLRRRGFPNASYSRLDFITPPAALDSARLPPRAARAGGVRGALRAMVAAVGHGPPRYLSTNLERGLP